MAKQKHTTAKDKVTKAKDKVTTANVKVTKSKDNVTMSKDKVTLPGRKGVHIGYTLGRLLKKLDMSAPGFARTLGISSVSARAMLKKKYLHAATLVRISEALQHDVVRYLYLPEDLPANPALKQQVDELEKENEALKEKVVMLEKMVKLLEKKG